MNKHLYRIVFNARRGLLMAVAETASAGGKAAGPSSPGRRPCATLRPLYFAILLAMGSGTPVAAQVIADPLAPRAQQPTVLKAANGAVVVNIQTPSAAGVSRNTFSRLDVDAQGLVLANTRTGASTLLAGPVGANPWLAGGTARVILSEVNASTPSQLRGGVEVGGDRAQVVIANPAGIQCEGCGFINAPRVTLTTGTPILNGGSLDGYRVQGGSITVAGAGLDASGADFTDLLARSVHINAGLWAQALQVRAGAAEMSADAARTVPLAGSGPAPAFAIDVAALGGMYAGKITLVGSESGVGVRNAGEIGASVGEVSISAAGRLENSGRLSAAGSVWIDARAGLANAGVLYAQGDARLSTQGNLENTGVVAAQGDAAVIAGGSVRSAPGALLAAGVRSDASPGPGGTLKVSATGSLTAQGANLAGEALTLHGASIDLSGSTTSAGRVELVAGAAGIEVRHATVVAPVSLAASTSGSLGAEGGSVLAGELTLSAQVLSNVQGQWAARNVALTFDRLDNRGGAIHADETLSLQGVSVLDNSAGLLSSRQQLTVQDASAGPRALQVANTGGTLVAGTRLAVSSAGLGGDGHLLSQGRLSLDLLTDFANSGEVQANDTLMLTTRGRVSNQGSLRAGSAVSLSAADLDNAAAGQIAGTTTQVRVNGALTNRGLIDGGSTTLEAGAILNRGTGRIYGDHLALRADAVANEAENGAAPTLAGRSRVDIGAQTLTNREHALLFSAGDMAIGGTLDGHARAAGSAHSVDNQSASIEALGQLSIDANQLRNTNEHFSTGLQRNEQSIVELQGVGSPTRYKPGDPGVTIYNDESDHLRTPEGDFESWLRYDYVRTTVTPVVTASDPGRITSGGAMRLQAASVLNDRSQIIAGGTLSGTIGTLVNTEVSGQQSVSDAGVAISYWRQHDKGRDSTGSSIAIYAPPAVITEIRLTPTLYLANTPPGGSAAQVPAPGTARPVDAILEVTLPSQVGDATAAVRTGALASAVPASSLFRVNPSPAAGPLVETDARFAGDRAWLSSDRMLGQLGLDPASTLQRLGDGFYEQKLLREQVAQLTGRRFVGDFTDDETQYRALMDNGVTVAKGLGLRPGIALTAAQMAQLTSDIVWLVEQEVTLPDGRTARALVPQVYVRVRPGDLDGAGALLSGRAVALDLSGDLINQGSIAGRDLLILSAENVKNLGGRLSAGQLAVQARTDLDNVGGTIAARTMLAASAGRDLNLTSTTRSNGNAQGSVTAIDRVAGLYVTAEPGGLLLASAGRDLHLQAAQVGNASAGGQTVLAAGRDLDLGTVHTGTSQALRWDAHNRRSDSVQQEVGSTVQATGDTRLSAGRDLRARGAAVTSVQGALVATAGNDLTLDAAEGSLSLDEAHRHTGRSSWLASKTVTTRDSVSLTTVQASTFSGNTTALQAGNDLRLAGSNAVSTAGTTLAAGHDVRVEAASERSTAQHLREERTSGLFSSGGIGFTIGTREQSQDNRETATTAVASTVGATHGSVAITAGQRYEQVGSNALAPQGNIGVQARSVEIREAQDTRHSTQESRFRQSGLTVAVTAPLVSAVQTVQQVARAGGQTSDDRMKVLAAATTALAVRNAADAVAADPASGGGINASITLGTTRSQSLVTQDELRTAASTVTAGGDVTIQARGAGRDSTLTVQGSDIRAGGNMALGAEGDVQLLAARNSSDTQRSASSQSGGVGVAISLTSKGVSMGATASASASRGNGDGHDVTWRDSHVEAGDTLSVQAGGDATLRGAVASGAQVAAQVGGDLNLLSLQDTSSYRSQDQSLGGSVTVGAGFSGSLNVGQQKIRSELASVTGQTGIHAGDRGFQVDVRGHTDLQGAVVTGSDAAVQQGVNRLSTATLTTSEIRNHAEYEASSVSLGGGYSVGQGGMAPLGGGGDGAGGVGANQQGQAATGADQVPGSALPKTSGGFSASVPLVMSASGSSVSVTGSGISGGALTVRDGDAQKARTGQDAAQAVASVGRAVTTGQDSSHALQPIFNEKEIQAGFEIVGALQRETGTYLGNRAKEIDQKNAQARDAEARATDLGNGLSDEQRLALRGQAIALAAEAQTLSDHWGPGGTYRQVVGALAAGAAGNVTGSMDALVQNSTVAYLQTLGAAQVKEIADALDSDSARAALHAVVGCTGAAGAGQSCAAGALGAAGGTVLNNLLDQVEGSTLTAQEKEARANLVGSLVAGIAAGVGGSATTAGIAARIETENNRLATADELKRIKQLAQGNPRKEERLMAAACALIHCEREFPEDSNAYRVYKLMSDLGASYDFEDERALLAGQGGYQVRIRFPLGTDAQPLFTYDWKDAVGDVAARQNASYRLSTRAMGGMQVLYGATAAMLGGSLATGSVGACLSTVGASCLTVGGGAALALWGFDQAGAGVSTVIEGEQQVTFGASVLQSTFGISPEAAEVLYDIAGGAGGYAAETAWWRMRVRAKFAAESQQIRFDKIQDLFDTTKAMDSFEMGIVPTKVKVSPARSAGGSTVAGTVKVLESQNLEAPDIMLLAVQLAGGAPYVQKANTVWVATVGSGQTVTLRVLSTSAVSVGARFSIELKGIPQLQQLKPGATSFELIFK